MDYNDYNYNDLENISEIQDEIIDKTFFNKYHCTDKIGEGSFGTIYKATYNSQNYALKFENIKSGHNLLQNEANIMIFLKGPNIPYIKTYGISGGYNILVMQLLGKNLGQILNERNIFSIKTVCILAYQMISILQFIHSKNIVHRDIKPENFLLGLNDKSSFLYLIDFGLAKKISNNNYYLNQQYCQKLIGTARYSSINAMRGNEQSCRDDLESLGYLLAFFLRGDLPWQNLFAENKEEKYKKILIRKLSVSSYELCYGFPRQFEQYIDYCKKLEFDDEPDYEMLKRLFITVLRNSKNRFDYIYDWSTYDEIQRSKKMFPNLWAKNDYNNDKENNDLNKNQLSLNKKYSSNSFYKYMNDYETENNIQSNNVQSANLENNEKKEEEKVEVKEENNDNKKEDENKNREVKKEKVCCCGIY